MALGPKLCHGRHLLLVLALCEFLASCGGQEPVRPRLVVLYSTCTLNKDYLAPYDPGVPYTPNLERFARDARVFLRHQTEAGHSGIAFASIFTGTQADRHGIYRHPRRMHDDNRLVAEAFADAGYDTWYWSGQPMASAALNYGQGVSEAQTILGPTRFRDMPAVADNGYLDGLTGNTSELAQVLERLRNEPDYRAFLQLNFTITHEPYQKYSPLRKTLDFCNAFPEEANGTTPEQLQHFLRLYAAHRYELSFDFPRTVERLKLSPRAVEKLVDVVEVFYKACVYQLDAYFGRFLDTLDAAGLDEETLVVFTADHGELMYRENALYPFSHGLQLAPEVLGVPLLVRGPGQGVSPGDFEGVTRSIDVFPSLCGLAGVPPGAGPQGVDLTSALRGEAAPPVLVAFSHTTTLDAQRVKRFQEMEVLNRYMPLPEAPRQMWVRKRAGDVVHKLRSDGNGGWYFERFDLARDPEETENLFDPGDPDDARSAEELTRYKSRLVEAHDRSTGGALPEDEELDALRALGYVR